MNVAILALIFGPSIVVFLAGCIIALYRTLVSERRPAASVPRRRRAY